MPENLQKQLETTLNKVTVLENVLENLFGVFKQSVDQLNNDHQYWIDKLKQMNDISEAMAERMKELLEGWLGDDDEQDDHHCISAWKMVLNEQKRNLTTLTETAGTYRKTIDNILKYL